MEHDLIVGLSPESSQFRFFCTIKDVTPETLKRFCTVNYDTEIAIIAEYITPERKHRNVGVGRLVKDPDGRSGEFAVLVADDFQGVGLGYKLTEMIIRIARDKGLKNIYGFILRDNVRMREVATTLGFTVRGVGADEVRVVLDL